MSTLVIAVLVFAFFILAMPEKGYSGVDPMAGGCCEYSSGLNGDFCESIDFIERCPLVKVGMLEDFFPGESCNEQTGLCIDPTRSVPTLSEWGLIATAGILGVIGFMVIRRRKATI